ncbi:MAG: hypothetical protein KDB80_14850 [Planctomycetes bacterium]|nr:hypothetical protein [Planctomycetota bacterium]
MIGAARFWLATALLASAGSAQDAISFERDVLPFLEAKCFKCHGTPQRRSDGSFKEPKGGLRLDGRAWIERGGDGEDAVVAGELEESGVYRRVSLPADDSDFMPSKGDPLTDAERETLRRWIENGADFGDWVGSPGPGADAPPARETAPVVVAARVALLQRLGEGLRPANPSAVQKIAGDSAQITAISMDSPLLRVSFRAAEPKTDDARVAELAPLREQITELVLARTKITDRALATIAKMPRLTRLDLSQTEITDAGLQKLQKLPELRALNLFGTKVTDRVKESLAEMPALEQVWLWRTEVSDGARDALSEKRPGLRVVGGPAWPVVPEQREDEDGNRRRR